MKRSTATLLAAVTMTLAAGTGSAQDSRTAQFLPEQPLAAPATAQPAAPTFVGKAMRRDARGNLVPIVRTPSATPSVARAARPPANRLSQGLKAPRHSTLSDYYVQDGSETAVAVNPWNLQNLVAAFNEGWDFEPDIPLSNSMLGTTQWTSRTFPPGAGVYGGYPFNPWCIAQNAPGQFLTSLIRRDLLPSDNARVLIARSTDNGASFLHWHEVERDVFQDRAMTDIDRISARGGTDGAQDGKVLLCYDDYGVGGGSFQGSYLRVIGPTGAMVSETQVSGTGTPPFRGNQFQPVASVNDGSFYLVSAGFTGGGATRFANFHETTDAGGTITYNKSSLSWAPAGQRLGTTSHWGVNGHRIDAHGFLDVDRSSGVRRGTLYFITNRNPNPSDPSQDQGDVWLSKSVNNGAGWTSARIPMGTGRTQYFPMMDVDEQGWVHVAYYENGSGILDGGALNAFAANVFYTLSKDGGQTWFPPTQVNEVENEMFLDDPPAELGAFDYYLIGDYMQMQAFGAGTNTAAYVLWTHYNTYRADDGVGTKKERIVATLVTSALLPAATPVQVAGLALLLMVLSAAALAFRRRPATATVPAAPTVPR